MKIAVSDAKGQLTELVRQAENGDEVILTRHGRPVVRVVPVQPQPDLDQRRKALANFRQAAALTITPGESAARSQDFLYDEFGLPKCSSSTALR